MSPAKAAPAVCFESTLYNGHACQTVVEPDGESGHWVRIDARQQQAAAWRMR